MREAKHASLYAVATTITGPLRFHKLFSGKFLFAPHNKKIVEMTLRKKVDRTSTKETYQHYTIPCTESSLHFTTKLLLCTLTSKESMLPWHYDNFLFETEGDARKIIPKPSNCNHWVGPSMLDRAIDAQASCEVVQFMTSKRSNNYCC